MTTKKCTNANGTLSPEHKKLACHRIVDRADLISFATQELLAMQLTIEQRREAYTDYLRRRIDRLRANLDMELLVEVESADIRYQMEGYLALLRGLEENFRTEVKKWAG